MPNHDAPVTPVSPKAAAAVVGGFLLPILFVIVNAIANALSTDPTFLQDLPPTWRQIIVIVLAAIGAGTGAYVKADPLRYHEAEPIAPAGDELVDPELAGDPSVPVDPELPPGA
jgi:hypothetical protein